MSGRVGKVAAGMANILNIHPILTMRDGKLDLLERVRTRKAATNRLVELVAAAVETRAIEQAAFLHVNNLQGAEELKALLETGSTFHPTR